MKITRSVNVNFRQNLNFSKYLSVLIHIIIYQMTNKFTNINIVPSFRLSPEIEIKDLMKTLGRLKQLPDFTNVVTISDKKRKICKEFDQKIERS